MLKKNKSYSGFAVFNQIIVPGQKTILEQLSHIAIVSFYKGTDILVPFL
jgi:hypothetical protein